MTQMVITSISGFVDLPDANIAASTIVTDDSLVKINQNAKFAAVRPEFIFMGYYVNGDTISLPSSPVDQYAYSYDEILFDFTMYSTRGPGTGFVSGQATAPVQAILQPANLYWTRATIDSSTGKVAIDVSYFAQGGAETITHDGIVKVTAICQRQCSVSEVIPIALSTPGDRTLVDDFAGGAAGACTDSFTQPDGPLTTWTTYDYNTSGLEKLDVRGNVLWIGRALSFSGPGLITPPCVGSVSGDCYVAVTIVHIPTVIRPSIAFGALISTPITLALRGENITNGKHWYECKIYTSLYKWPAPDLAPSGPLKMIPLFYYHQDTAASTAADPPLSGPGTGGHLSFDSGILGSSIQHDAAGVFITAGTHDQVVTGVGSFDVESYVPPVCPYFNDPLNPNPFLFDNLVPGDVMRFGVTDVGSDVKLYLKKNGTEITSVTISNAVTMTTPFWPAASGADPRRITQGAYGLSKAEAYET